MTKDEFLDFMKTAEIGSIIVNKINKKKFILDEGFRFDEMCGNNILTVSDILEARQNFEIEKEPRKKEFLFKYEDYFLNDIFNNKNFKFNIFISREEIQNHLVRPNLKVTIEEIL